jgi:predicted O-methyltransferase YrrM
VPSGPDLEAGGRSALERVAPIPGWMRDEDVLKLYELAYLSPGPILEIGSARGKSAAVVASALRDASSPAPFVSLDVDSDAVEAAASELAGLGLADRVLFVRGSARAFFRSVSHFAPTLVFVDGDHSLSGVTGDLRELEPQLARGGFLLFHDYDDPRNRDPDDDDYGVIEAVERSWVAGDCEFVGVFGCCGLFRRVTGGAAEGERGGAPTADLSHRDTLRLRLLGRLRLPLGRRYRRLRDRLRR